jgi:AcrR family transcriptional regulator
MADEPTTLRARRAQLTRDEILIAARRLFAERGYSRTSVRDIAREAGVSAQTVYDSIGSKRALVARLNDVIDVEAGVADIARRAAESSDPHEVVITGARITRAILEHCGDIIRALVTGAAAEPDLAAVLDEGHRRHLAGALEQADAVESLAAVTDFRFALVLRDDYGWSLDRIENWIASTSQTLLLET